MKSWTQPTDEMIEKALSSVKKEIDRQYFFSRLNNPLWLEPIARHGYFKYPPGIKQLPNGYVQYPKWPELTYLVNVADKNTDQVVDTVLSFPKTDNPQIYDGILEVALKLNCGDSAKLLSKIIEGTELEHQIFAHRYPDLLCHWIDQGNINEALELAKRLVPFQEDPKSAEKRTLRKNVPNAWTSSLNPAPRFSEWEYQQILEQGIRRLAEIEPYETASFLIDAVVRMIWLGIHHEDIDKERDEDYSEIWCPRLDISDSDCQDSQKTLLHSLTFACKQVFDNARQAIEQLDQSLRAQRWKVFKRLRQHLYALHPNEQTLPWIREFILGYKDYANLEYHYEFQLMIRKACEHFGPTLFTEAEKLDIFDSILKGPSIDDFKEWMGEWYSDEAFNKRQRYFHRKQLRPFASLLNDKYRSYFEELESEDQKERISDDDYSPYRSNHGGVVTYKSPKTIDELGTLADEALLVYINEWKDERHDNDNWLIEINISALSGVFQSLFKETIVQDEKRLAFWIEHRENIERPIYIAAMVKAMQELVKEQTFDNLDNWVEFCEWILMHSDTARMEGEPKPNHESSEHYDWKSSRRAVVDFIDVCLNKDVNVPITLREGLANLLHILCKQFDWRLDCNYPVVLNSNEPVTEAINNTRSRALESLINFGFWVRRNSEENVVSEVCDILNKRLDANADIALTKPEYAILGMHFGNLCVLNQDWSIQNKDLLFPRSNIPVWLAAFTSFVRFNNPKKLTFDILREDFEFALDHLELLAEIEGSHRDIIDTLGQHLFFYYLWEVYPLSGKNSLLEQFYENTNEDRQRWSNLFDHIGRSLRNSNKNLAKDLIERVTDFFDWRFKVREPMELQKFTFWLDSECLNPEWRLDAYSKILDIIVPAKDISFSIEVKTLNRLLPEHLYQVVECFRKMMDSVKQDSSFYISPDDAKPILKAGLNSADSRIRDNAACARENLLRIGRFDFLEID